MGDTSRKRTKIKSVNNKKYNQVKYICKSWGTTKTNVAFMFAARTQMAEQTFRLFQSFCVGYMRVELLFSDIF